MKIFTSVASAISYLRRQGYTFKDTPGLGNHWVLVDRVAYVRKHLGAVSVFLCNNRTNFTQEGGL